MRLIFILHKMLIILYVIFCTNFPRSESLMLLYGYHVMLYIIFEVSKICAFYHVIYTIPVEEDEGIICAIVMIFT